MSQRRIAAYCMWLTVVMLSRPLVGEEPSTEAPPTELAVLDALVGSWKLQSAADVGISARQECQWILNRQFLEIDTHVHFQGQPPSFWRTLISYDTTDNCYRQWKFSGDGDVSTATGAWNRKTSALKLTGRTRNGNAEESRIRIINDRTMEVDVREFLDEQHTRMAAVAITLDRVPSTKDQQLTTP